MPKNSIKKAATLDSIMSRLETFETRVNKGFDSLKKEIIGVIGKSFENEHEYFEGEFAKVSKYNTKVDTILKAITPSTKHHDNF